MPADFTVYTDPDSARRIAQIFASAPQREVLLAAIRNAHPGHHARAAIDPRPLLSTPIISDPAAPVIEAITPEPELIEIQSPS